MQTPIPKKKTLTNGLRYLYIPMKNTETVLAMVLVGTGADFETKIESGLAHFLEHMCFKGTVKRPTAKDIALEFDRIGADYNAFTGRAYTGYYARAHKKHGAKIIEMVSDIYLNSVFPEDEIKKEQGVVIQEMNMYMDDPQYRVQKLSSELLYGDQPAGRDIIGTKETVSSFNRDNLLKYHSGQYTAKNTVVIVAGNIAEKSADTDIQKLFGTLKSGKKNQFQKTSVSQNQPQVSIQYKETDQTHLVLSFRGFDFRDKRVQAGKSLIAALSGGMSSRLYHKMREELGICYYVYANLNTGFDTGELTVSAGVSNDRVGEAIQGIVEELVKIKKEGVTEHEMEKVREYRLSGLVLHLETVEDYANFFGREEVVKGKFSLPKTRADEISSITSKQVHMVAKDLIQAQKANLAIVGPFREKDKPQFVEYLKKIR
ncbi:MAG: insulinase family protein [Candidatus Taylorbacteria bacterium]|nr:insulinase family protein [Candidatus Taylorbacteria bacterium]